MTTAAGSRPTGAWSEHRLREAITGSSPLVEGYRSLDDQVQPNGFDLTLETVSAYTSAGTIGRDNTSRVLPELTRLDFDSRDRLRLDPGAYHVAFNEVVRLPLTAMALGRPRSSLNRSGVTIHTAVWDAGYHGRSTAMLHVINPNGFTVERDSRVLQLVFFDLSEASEQGYMGVYQHENLGTDG